VVEGARLESVCRGNSTVGSNPTLSANSFVVGPRALRFQIHADLADATVKQHFDAGERIRTFSSPRNRLQSLTYGAASSPAIGRPRDADALRRPSSRLAALPWLEQPAWTATPSLTIPRAVRVDPREAGHRGMRGSTSQPRLCPGGEQLPDTETGRRRTTSTRTDVEIALACDCLSARFDLGVAARTDLPGGAGVQTSEHLAD
jgi:hypothetical protein